MFFGWMRPEIMVYLKTEVLLWRALKINFSWQHKRYWFWKSTRLLTVCGGANLFKKYSSFLVSDNLTEVDLSRVESFNLMPCPYIFHQIAFRYDGRVSPCCGIASEHPLFEMGNIKQNSTKEIVERGNDNIFFNWLTLEGPYNMMKVIKSRYPSYSFSKNYTSLCHICAEITAFPDIKKFFATYGKEKALQFLFKKATMGKKQTSLRTKVYSKSGI